MIGKTVQKYRIERELGSGAMGAVYQAVDTLTERPVAMKVLRAELARQPELIERFRSEAVTLARLNHPNIAILYDFFLDGEDYYMCMEFVRGQPLESIIRSAGCVEASMAARIMSQTLEALSHAHSMGVLHRDIKPANIMVTGDGRVKVTDFGIARVLGSSRMTRTGRIIGTLEYIAPERIRGDEADPRSDLYSAGVVLFEMLTGKLPFTSQTDFELIKSQLEQEPPGIGHVLGSASPEDWDAVVRKAMAKSTGQRFQTAEEFCYALPVLAATLQSGSHAPAMGLKPTRLAGTAPSDADFRPDLQQAPQAPAWQSEPAPRPTGGLRKLPPLALVLGAGAVLAVVFLMVAIVMRIRANNQANEGTTPAPAGVTSPARESPPLDPQRQDGSMGASPQIVTVPTVTGNGSVAGKSATKSPRDDRRDAALRALEGKDPNSKNSRRSAALKALDQ
jgi:eukaryotic-like serine/threonine-protein kinase